jgi:NAD(P)H dehydrogenase (quinone)
MTDLLVTGASGHLGQRVLHHLVETLGVAPSRIVAATRKPEALADWTSRGVTARAADFDDPASLDKAFSGVKRLLVISTDAVGAPGKRLEQHRKAIDAAGRAGVSHVVYTSLPGAFDSLVSFAPDHAGTETALKDSALPGWSVLRNHWYAENLLHALPSALASGHWYSAAGDGGIPYIARDDLARAAAAALASEFSGKRTLTLGGDKTYTAAEVARLVSAATGRPLTVVPVSIDDLIKGMMGAGLPEPVARTFASFDANTAAHKFEIVTGDYKALTGLSPQSLESWVKANAAAFTAHPG